MLSLMLIPTKSDKRVRKIKKKCLDCLKAQATAFKTAAAVGAVFVEVCGPGGRSRPAD